MKEWIISGWIHLIIGLAGGYFVRPYIDKAIDWLKKEKNSL